MLSQGPGTIASLYDHNNTPLPEVIQQAQRDYDMAQAVAAEIRADVAPQLDASDAKKLSASITAKAVHELTREKRAKIAGTRVSGTKDQLDLAWQSAGSVGGEIYEAMRGWYADAADRFTAALAELGGQTNAEANLRMGRVGQQAELERAALDLTRVVNARAQMQSLREVADQHFWKWTQFVSVPDIGAATKLDRAMKGKQEGTPEWWAHLLAQPGVTLCYRDVAEQREYFAELRKPKTA